MVVLDPPEDVRQPWTVTGISEGIVSTPGGITSPQAAPGIFGVGDVDHDGDQDLVVSGDGDPNVYWLEQVAAGSFETRVLQSDLPQAGGTHIEDLDGDGRAEVVVTGYEQNAVYVYTRP